MQPLAGRASAQSGVRGMVRAYIDWVVQHPDRARLLHELKRSGDLADGPGEREQANAEGFGLLRKWVDAQVEAGEMRAMPFTVFQAVVFSPALALTPYWVRQPQPEVPPKVRTALELAAWAAVVNPGAS
jgi:hypothetical protein